MSFDRSALARATHAHGPVMRVVIVRVRGSTPREVGASMLVWPGGQSGTIGGGELEFQAAARARKQAQPRALVTLPLGPELGQCCGGAVTLLMERFDIADTAMPLPYARPLDPHDDPADMPQSVARLVQDGALDGPTVLEGWFIEPELRPAHSLWIYGAGHVGRAIVGVMAPLPDWRITWVDTSPSRYPATREPGVSYFPAVKPADAVRHAPDHAEHLIVTYSHEMDLEICHRLLSRDFAYAGLIGSDTKWARFRTRLAQLGHGPAHISRITCPIGDPGLGKHPQAIAVGVAADLLTRARAASHAAKDGATGDMTMTQDADQGAGA